MPIGHDDEQVLVFELASQRFGLPVDAVQEVLPLATLVAVPRAPSGFAGILRLRGALLPVIDLRHCLGLPSVPPKLEHRIVVTHLDRAHAGLLVDAVHGLLAAGAPAPRPPGQAQPNALERIVNTPEGVVMLLDPDGCISPALRDYLAATDVIGDASPGRALHGRVGRPESRAREA